MKIPFNNDAEAIWYKWSGGKESFEEYLASPHGISDMLEKRQKSPVNVYIEKEKVYVAIWSGDEGVEIRDARKNGS
jgi:hypothetical protein